MLDKSNLYKGNEARNYEYNYCNLSIHVAFKTPGINR